ncbi:response regulator [Paenibacillus sp. LHD-38]|uniref:response regulator transcription factor n=1 Tax=Paenibacillus sp. LHD-38 TaxID=3072143 RepID=UPI0028106BD6|nr:response regulator [Paenibacillus sp. LHD-38]MDQ8736583.1 response regulator [Paenibacillus sp. LHD-38]
MTSLLIVDDDQYIREGLKRLINWKALNITRLSEAEGAYEALELMEAYKAHIVLTDIRMPKGDGLHLIEQIRLRNWNTSIVVLSGYNEYAYVRQAMKHQVEDYLLKPIDASELTEIIASCTERFQGQYIAEQMQRESFQLLKNNILLRWVQNRIQYDQLREKLKFLQLPLLMNERYQICIIDWRDRREGELTRNEEQYRSFAILNSVEEVLQESGRGIAFLNEHRQIIVLFTDEGNDADCFSASNHNWMTDLSKRYGEILKTPWVNYFGKVTCMPRLLHESYSEALGLCNNNVLLDTDQEIDLISQNPITRQVERYVQKNYSEELSLQLLSLHFNVNNVYLGRLFKKETGQSFNDYLNRIRLNHAKKMLAVTALKASEIATAVGFLDPNYFFRKFKLVHDISPSDYRLSVNNHTEQ